MKTAWIISDCEPLPCDKNPRLMRAGQLAEYLSQNGWNVVWYAPGFNHGEKKDRFLQTQLIQVNPNEKLVALYSPVTYQKNTSVKRISFYKHLTKELIQQFKQQEKPDIIYCSWPTMSFAKEALKFGKEFSVPVVLDVRDLWPDIFVRVFPSSLQAVSKCFLAPLFSMAQKLFRRADAIIGVTPSALEWGLKKAGREKKETDRVIYIGYKDEPGNNFSDAEFLKWKSFGVEETTWNVTYFGTFSTSSLDMEACICGFNQFSTKHPDARLVLCGAGDAEKRFHDLANGNPHIVFPGWCSNEQIQSLLTISDIGLYPFKNTEDFKDAFGNKIIGYMAAKLPVITSLEGFANTYMTQYAFGKAYKEGDADSFETILQDFYEKRSECTEMGKRARERFETDFDMQIVNKQFVELFEELMEKFR